MLIAYGCQPLFTENLQTCNKLRLYVPLFNHRPCLHKLSRPAFHLSRHAVSIIVSRRIVNGDLATHAL